MTYFHSIFITHSQAHSSMTDIYIYMFKYYFLKHSAHKLHDLTIIFLYFYFHTKYQIKETH